MLTSNRTSSNTKNSASGQNRRCRRCRPTPCTFPPPSQLSAGRGGKAGQSRAQEYRRIDSGSAVLRRDPSPRSRIRHQDHVRFIDRFPSGDRRAVKHDAVGEHLFIDGVNMLSSMLQLPRGSVKRRSTYFTSFSLIRSKTLLTSDMMSNPQTKVEKPHRTTPATKPDTDAKSGLFISCLPGADNADTARARPRTDHDPVVRGPDLSIFHQLGHSEP